LGKDLAKTQRAIAKEPSGHDEARAATGPACVTIDFRIVPRLASFPTSLLQQRLGIEKKDDMEHVHMHRSSTRFRRRLIPAYESKSDWKSSGDCQRNSRKFTPVLSGEKETDCLSRLPNSARYPCGNRPRSGWLDWKKGEMQI